jgi:hypothetical protein
MEVETPLSWAVASQECAFLLDEVDITTGQLKCLPYFVGVIFCYVFKNFTIYFALAEH